MMIKVGKKLAAILKELKEEMGIPVTQIIYMAIIEFKNKSK